MPHSDPHADLHAAAQRHTHVLAGCRFPAAKWQLIMHAEEYGADAATRAELWGMPTGSYPDLAAVLAALGLVPVPSRTAPGHRPPPVPRAASQPVPRPPVR